MNPWARFVAWTSGTESATAQALFRIGMGLGVWHTLGPVVWRGLVPVLWVDRVDGGMVALGRGPWLVSWLGGPHPHVVWPLVFVALAGATAAVAGVGGRALAFVTLLAVNALGDVNPYAGGSYDMLLVNGLWLVVLSGGHETLSVHARVRTGRWWPEVQVWSAPRWFMGWQLVLMYGATGLQKVSAYWVPGGEASALYYILQQPEWQRRSMTWIAPYFPLTQVATTITWIWEVTAPVWLLAVWYAATPERGGRLRRAFAALHVRTLFAVTGIVMHAVIFATMDVGPFSFLSLVFYVAMASPAEWERVLRRAPDVTSGHPA